MSSELEREVARRRTFAIISHPDAGKTTLTEKLLLYGGAIHLAGSVKAATARSATPPATGWSSRRSAASRSPRSVLQFDYRGHAVNLLDTPGHQDFSEDTYRTLAAADAAVMLIDAAKGVEPQTKKLFEVCRMRGIPIFTFVNKLDRYGREPLELMDELEQVLGIRAYPMNWPIGMGPEFRGVYDRRSQAWCTSSRAEGRHGETRGRRARRSRSTRPEIAQRARASASWRKLQRGHRAARHRRRRVHPREGATRGSSRPMFFGCAMTNFGVRPFLDAFLELAPAARGRARPTTGRVEPDEPEVLRLRLQDPGEHGPGAPRPHRVRARRARAAT